MAFHLGSEGLRKRARGQTGMRGPEHVVETESTEVYFQVHVGQVKGSSEARPFIICLPTECVQKISNHNYKQGWRKNWGRPVVLT